MQGGPCGCDSAGRRTGYFRAGAVPREAKKKWRRIFEVAGKKHLASFRERWTSDLPLSDRNSRPLAHEKLYKVRQMIKRLATSEYLKRTSLQIHRNCTSLGKYEQ